MNIRSYLLGVAVLASACDQTPVDPTDVPNGGGKSDGVAPCTDDADCDVDLWCIDGECLPQDDEEDPCNLIDCPPDAPVCIDGECLPQDDEEDPCNLIDCPPDAPVCIDGECLPNDDEDCEDPCHLIDCPPNAPVCVDGTCVPE